jgi:hypothetical protein
LGFHYQFESRLSASIKPTWGLQAPEFGSRQVTERKVSGGEHVRQQRMSQRTDVSQERAVRSRPDQQYRVRSRGRWIFSARAV